MKQSRIENLSDGIFAIVMTLLVLEIHVPSINILTDYDLARQLYAILPLFLSYILSFSLLYTYWQAHHFTISTYAKTLDMTVSNYNAFFLFLIALIPFTARFLGEYSTYQLPVIIFSAHVIAIGMTLYFLRRYVKKSEHIENEDISGYEQNHSYARILVPVICAFVAIFISFISIKLSLVFLTLAILFNLAKSSTRLIFKFFRIFNRRIEG